MDKIIFCIFIELLAMEVSSAPFPRGQTKSMVNRLSKQLSKTELSESPRLHMSKAGESHLAVREGESLILECGAVGVPAPIIYWQKDGRRVKQASGDDEANFFEKLTNFGSSTVESSSTVGRLHLDCVDASAAGIYECVADNGFKKIVNRTQLVVMPRNIRNDQYLEETPSCLSIKKDASESSEIMAIAPRIILFTEWRFEKQGNNVQLFCRANGVPRPKITWLNENLEAVESGDDVSILSNGDLFIRDVQSMGQYYCVASNIAGEAKMDSFLYVTKPDDEASDI